MTGFGGSVENDLDESEKEKQILRSAQGDNRKLWILINFGGDYAHPKSE
jgi:hypothetical protein